MRSLHQLFLCVALIATTSTAQAQERGPRGFGSPSGALLLGQKSVQEDLELNEEQVKQVGEFAAKQRAGLSGLRDASREERAKRFSESREAGQKAVDTILNEEQRVRLKQIALQLAGPAAFVDPAVNEKLALTDEQKKSIAEIQSGHREEVRSLMQGDGDRAEGFKKIQVARQATEEKLKGLLTEEQKTKLQELTGKKFEGRLEGGRGPGRGRGRAARGGEDAGLRRDRPLGERDTTVLTADKSDEDRLEKAAAKKRGGEKHDGKKRKAKHKRANSNEAHAKHARHRKHCEHAARHHGRHHARGPHSQHAHHGKNHRAGGCEHGISQRGRHPQARYAQARHRGHGFDARRQAWNRVAQAMGANHRFDSPHHFAGRHSAHSRYDSHRSHDARAHFAQSRHGAGQHFRGVPHDARHGRGERARFADGGSSVGNGFRAHHDRAEHAFHHHFDGRTHGRHGFGGSRVGNEFVRREHGPARPNFGWHMARHREEAAGFEDEHGPRGPHPRLHPAGFKKRQHDSGEHREQDGKHQKKAGRGDRRHGKRDSAKAPDKHQDGGHKPVKKDKDADKKETEKKDD